MIENAKWIWVPQAAYPKLAATAVSVFDAAFEKTPFAVVQCKKTIASTTAIRRLVIEISADVKFRLFVNGQPAGLGPVCSGGDYGNARPMPARYYNRYVLQPDTDTVEIAVEVVSRPVVQCDMSQGRPGLIAAVEATDANGQVLRADTDESWSVRVAAAYTAPCMADFRLNENAWLAAEPVENTVPLLPAPIEMLAIEDCPPTGFAPFTVQPGQQKTVAVAWDYVYALYYRLAVEATDTFTAVIADYERYPEQAAVAERVDGRGNLRFAGLEMHSAAAARLTVQNTGKSPVTVTDFSAYYVHYPRKGQGSFVCSDERLNRLYLLGRHTLEICRQSLELDSPKHQENLGCTGDYYIASLMNYMTDGDTALSRLDVVRTARYLEMTDGYLFHTTYSMLWIQMLYDCYLYSGQESLLRECLPALKKLLRRFAGYVGKRGFIDNAPNYMFLDWLTVDGFALHHPPMALGQAALNAFYYGGLQTAQKILSAVGEDAAAEECAFGAERLKAVFHHTFYDAERRLYFDGLNEAYAPNDWCPQNSSRRYFSLHTNALAVLYGLAPQPLARDILQRALQDDRLPVPQPYFMHFVLDAIDRVGLFEGFGMRLLERWHCMLEFPKGLQEGWDTGCGGYVFDYSHVWGGTPTYQLPQKLLGLEIVTPGWKAIRLRPRLCGLSHAEICVPTPFGDLRATLSETAGTTLQIPDGITLVP